MDLFNVGQKVSIFIEKESKLVEITGTINGVYDDRLGIALPQYFMRYINHLEENCPLTVKVFSKLGTIDFNTIVIQSPLDDDFTVELDYNAIKLTSGEELPVISSIVNINLSNKNINKTVKTIEISTEYLKFYGDNTFNIGDDFACELILPPKYGTIHFRATLTEIDPIYDNECKISYYNLTEQNKQALLFYMYEYISSLNQEDV